MAIPLVLILLTDGQAQMEKLCGRYFLRMERQATLETLFHCVGRTWIHSA
jgi:hypothetical protein